MINKNGQVYSLLTNKYLKHSILPSGYEIVTLMLKSPRRSKTEYIHRLLAETFILNPLNKKTVNHIDCNKSNNKLSNLEWATQSENNIHALKNNLRIPNVTGLTEYRNSRKVLSESDIVFIKTHKHLSTKEISKIIGNTHLYAISDCKLDRSYKNYFIDKDDGDNE